MADEQFVPPTAPIRRVPTEGSDQAPLGLNLGPRRREAPGPWDAKDTASTNEFLKQLLTIGGTTVGGLVAGPPGAIAGGAVGRNVGSVPERLTAAAERRPAESSVAVDTPVGAMEGGIAEMLPAALHPTLKYGGQFARFIGSRLRGNPFTGIGGVPLNLGGEIAEKVADWMGPGTLSSRIKGGVDALERRLGSAAERPVVVEPSGPRTKWWGSEEVPYQMDPGATPPASPSLPGNLQQKTGTDFAARTAVPQGAGTRPWTVEAPVTPASPRPPVTGTGSTVAPPPGAGTRPWTVEAPPVTPASPRPPVTGTGSTVVPPPGAGTGPWSVEVPGPTNPLVTGGPSRPPITITGTRFDVPPPSATPQAGTRGWTAEAPATSPAPKKPPTQLAKATERIIKAAKPPASTAAATATSGPTATSVVDLVDSALARGIDVDPELIEAANKARAAAGTPTPTTTPKPPAGNTNPRGPRGRFGSNPPEPSAAAAPAPMASPVAELVDPSRMPEALLTDAERAARDARAYDRTARLADASRLANDYAIKKYGTGYYPKLTPEQLADVNAFEKHLAGGVDVEAAQIDDMVEATTRQQFGRSYADLLPEERAKVDHLRRALAGEEPRPPQRQLPADLETTLRARHAAHVDEFNASQRAAVEQGYRGPVRKPSTFDEWLEDEVDFGEPDAVAWTKARTPAPPADYPPYPPETISEALIREGASQVGPISDAALDEGVNSAHDDLMRLLKKKTSGGIVEPPTPYEGPFPKK
jgi:hypothetical protein